MRNLCLNVVKSLCIKSRKTTNDNIVFRMFLSVRLNARTTDEPQKLAVKIVGYS